MTDPVAARFGPLAGTMLTDTPLAPIWRISFLANFFTGPLYADLEARFDLSRPGFVILYCLSQEDGLMARDVARLSGLPKNSVSRAVAAIAQRGLVETGAGADRRAKPLRLTPAGRALLATVLPLCVARQAAMLSPLSPGEQRDLLALLDKLVQAAPAWVDGRPALAE
ncbi:MAG: MarR family winged helix-turn-helix transcriptional regulator [Pseudomonadota bacterium]